MTPDEKQPVAQEQNATSNDAEVKSVEGPTAPAQEEANKEEGSEVKAAEPADVEND